MTGVPQIVFPSNVFERQYNPDSIERLGVGKRYLDTQFTSFEVAQAVQATTDQAGFIHNIGNI
jgi:Glycosyl transferases, related to UDP-glucuronosyltransferase